MVCAAVAVVAAAAGAVVAAVFGVAAATVPSVVCAVAAKSIAGAVASSVATVAGAALSPPSVPATKMINASSPTTPAMAVTWTRSGSTQRPWRSGPGKPSESSSESPGRPAPRAGCRAAKGLVAPPPPTIAPAGCWTIAPSSHHATAPPAITDSDKTSNHVPGPGQPTPKMRRNRNAPAAYAAAVFGSMRTMAPHEFRGRHQ